MGDYLRRRFWGKMTRYTYTKKSSRKALFSPGDLCQYGNQKIVKTRVPLFPHPGHIVLEL